jgi:hypothetical protein
LTNRPGADAAAPVVRRVARCVAERLALGLAALVLALFGGMPQALVDGAGRGDRPASRISAELTTPTQATLPAQRAAVEEEGEDGQAPVLGGGSVAVRPVDTALPGIGSGPRLSGPAEVPAPVGPRRHSPRLPTGPPAVVAA